MRRITFIDAKNLVFRAGFGVGKLSYKGKPTNVLHGFPTMLLDCMDYVGEGDYVIVWDGPPPNRKVDGPAEMSWRKAKAVYANYKGNRGAPSQDVEDIYAQLPELARLLDIAGFLQIGERGLEADDLLGICGADQARAGNLSYLYSNDKDLYQLASVENLLLIVPKEGGGVRDLDCDDILRKTEIHPENWAKLKALMGDASDNYKPVPGVGAVNAAKYLKAGADPSLPYFADHPKPVQAAIEKLRPFWPGIVEAYMLAVIPTVPDYEHFDAALRSRARRALLEVREGAQRRFLRKELDKRVQDVVKFCSAYALDFLLSRRRDFFRYV